MKNNSSIALLSIFLRPWKKNIFLASLYSSLNKIFDIAPEVLIGVAVDLVVKKNDSFIASLGFETISSQVLFLGFITFLIWALESFFEYLLVLDEPKIVFFRPSLFHHLDLKIYLLNCYPF